MALTSRFKLPLQSLSLALAASLALPALAQAAEPARLVGRSVLPADTFTTGPTAGQDLGTALINGRQAPFVNKHPVQGFSGVLDAGDGSFWLCGDNGFGAIENSADHHLRVYRVKPSFKAAKGQGPGGMAVLGYFELRDPDRLLPYPITHQFTRERVLTGADLDIESFQRASDGSFWFGDEFGPFLVHTDATGKVLEPPVSLPDFSQPGRDVRSPQSPLHEETAALRFMNALRAHARAHGATRSPVFSPYHLTLDDANPATVSPLRVLPGSPSSELHGVKLLQAAGHAVVPWTVNDLAAMKSLLKLGVRGLISDRPDLLREAVAGFDADGDGRPGDYLDADGLIDSAKFDAQGHRGARDLRPESTFPAFEAALDQLVSTLETDCAITRDGVPVLSHEPDVTAAFARRPDGGEVHAVIHHLTLKELQSRYVLDRLQPTRPAQSRDLAGSPVAVAFARTQGLASPYAMPSLKQLFAFVRAYEQHYRTGAGKAHPESARRAKNASRVKFDLETKLSPSLEARGLTPGFKPFAHAVAGVVKAEGLESRTQIQSFDYRTLLEVHVAYPAIQTVFLLGDELPFGMRAPGTPAPAGAGPENGWAQDVVWPYRMSARENPFRSQRTGGFEAMAISPDGTKLYPMLEKPLTGESGVLPIYEFDLATRRYTGLRGRYPLAPGSTSVPDFIMTGPATGLLIERDDREGDMTAFKKVYRVDFKGAGETVAKTEVVDLLRLADPDGYSGRGAAGDVGLGANFGLPFFTIEGIVKLGPNRLGIVTDNNYPFSVGRHRGAMQPDDSEFVIIETTGL
jgi:glycerophosphoryl diester phosphodiesterase